MKESTMVPPFRRKVGGIFIPVSDVHRARAWYKDVLGLPVGDVQFGHLCCISMDDGVDLLLDQKLTPDGGEKDLELGAYPLFMFESENVEESLSRLQERGVRLASYNGTIIQNGHWFNFYDSEGNLLMVCA